MKKIKTQTLSSESNSNQSPTTKENFEENDSNGLESTSMIEEINSPSAKSFCEDNETLNAHRMLEGVLIPQRSISTPLIVNTFNLRHAKAEGTGNHQRVQHALEVLQKKMLMDQQASLLKDILSKVQATHEPLIIPPLKSASEMASTPLNFGEIKKIPGFEDDHEIIYGPVEYPLLAMAPPLFGDLKTSLKRFNSLSATRADTQKSDSDDVSSEASESSESVEVKGKKSKKSGNVRKTEKAGKKKGEKVQRSEKTKSKKQK